MMPQAPLSAKEIAKEFRRRQFKEFDEALCGLDRGKQKADFILQHDTLYRSYLSAGQELAAHRLALEILMPQPEFGKKNAEFSRIYSGDDLIQHIADMFHVLPCHAAERLEVLP
ncbi:hypothetical protein [Candidatus Tokpelaia sp.]|uniref:hypothetical protein n=1 Tax=Candidatus Tokpelaia sp. TaxID=2233777 RepID=UPI0012391467|nr:hypothetical protein [Candidatus Tokpelaia sp.]KAA6405793.1 hypothetical protein DPQ22_02925 [Candidatus Tokpelaia sp.]